MLSLLRRTLIGGVLFALMSVTLFPAAAQVQTYALASVRDAVLLYYNAINLRDYTTAYAMRVNPTQSYQQFAGGFGDTLRGVPYIGSPQAAANGAQNIPLVLIAYRTNGTIVSYYGCFTLATDATAAWKITRTQLRSIPGGGYPNGTTILNYLGIQCATMALPGFTPAFLNLVDSASAEAMMYTYFDQINLRSYAAAYAMWLAPNPSLPAPNGSPATDFRPNYTSYVNGYADTHYVTLYTALYQYMGAAAGRPYLDGMLPVVVIGTNSRGQSTTYRGCFVVGRFPGSPSLYGIVNGRLFSLSSGIADASSILSALTLDCTTLNIAS